MIDLKDITKVFKQQQKSFTAVEDVNLTIQKGEIFGIVGYSGAGKSTLVRMLNGLEKPTSGSVKINDVEMTELKGKAMRMQRYKIGMIFQHFNLLWSRTVLQNIMLPMEISHMTKSERLSKAQKLVSLVGLEGKENSYPSELSGGQKQRVGIARALATDPEILLCDEATSALDPQTTDEVLDLLATIQHKLDLTIILITHEMHVIRKICRRMAVMENGRIVEEGNVLDIFKDPQEEVTKRFVQSEVSPDYEDTTVVLKELAKQYPDGKIIALTFHGEQTKMPIISTLIKKYELELSVIEGSIHQTQEGAIGSLYIQVLGAREQIEAGIVYLHQMHVATEVIEDE